MLRPNTLALTVLLAFLAGLNPLTMDSFAPSMPAIAESLQVSGADVLLSLAAYFVGSSIGTMIYGPVADRYGRKPVLISALLIYFCATVVCALAPNVEVLILGRAMQALGPSGTQVITRTMIRDLYDGPGMVRQMSAMMSGSALGPILAPLLGGFLSSFVGWRAIFYMLLIYVVVLLVIAWFKLPETLKLRAPEPVTARRMLSDYRIILRNPAFISYVGMIGFTFFGMVAWIATAPFVLQHGFQLSAIGVGLALVSSNCGFVFGLTLARRIVPRYGLDRAIGIGAVLLVAAGTVMLGLAFVTFHAVALVLPMLLYMIGAGCINAQAFSGALAPFRERAGAASSLAGLIQLLSSATTVIVGGRIIGDSAPHLAAWVAAGGLATLLVWWFTREIRAREGGYLSDSQSNPRK